MSSLRIVMTAGVFPPDIGGPANFVPRIADWLTQRGHQVAVVCSSDTVDHDDSHYAFKVYRVGRSQPRSARLLQTVRLLRQLGQRAHVIFANTLHLEARLAAAWAGKPDIHKVVGDKAWETARVRGWFTDTIDCYQQAPKSPRLWLLDGLRTFSLARAHRVVVPSQYLANIVSGWSLPTSPQVIYNSTPPVSTAEADWRLPAYGGPTLTTICRLVSWKGVDRLIVSLQQLPTARLVVAGDGPEREALGTLAERLKLSDRVIFAGRLSRSHIGALLSQSDLFVLNSSYEGLPHVVLEAMAAGVPVVATDVGGTREVVQSDQTGMLIPSGDNAALVAACQRLLTNEAERQRLVTHARQLIRAKFSESACFTAYEQVLQAAATGAQPATIRAC
ncbi:MAG: glycosyltransferase family 4 protein [Cyanobacteria bacterium J06648_16]